MDKHMNRRRFLELTVGTGATTLVGGALVDLSSQNIPTAFAAPAARSSFDSSAASNWEDAFLSGNGRYGIMVYGNPLSETVIFNDHKFDQPIYDRVTIDLNGSTGNGYFYLVNDHSGLRLDVSGASTTQGTAVIQWSSNGGLNQHCQLVAVA